MEVFEHFPQGGEKMGQGVEDTIVAPATPFGMSAIGIVRMSGEMAFPILRRIFRRLSGEPPEEIVPRYAVTGYIVGQKENEIIDECVCVPFVHPHSYTGEDLVEFHCHGSPVILRRVTQLLVEQGCRIAEPGEFTRRAFLNGKMDLSQAEAVAELIASLSEESAKAAISHLQGSLFQALSSPVEQLKSLLASLQVVIDYADEEVEEMPDSEVENVLQMVQQDLTKILSTYRDGKILREGALVVIAGKTNVGKSSLLNRLLKEERALVSPFPGTTRDYLVEWVEILGIPVRLTDTAGLRKTIDVVEEMGAARTLKWIQEADLVLFLFDSSLPTDEDDAEAYQQIQDRPHLLIGNKCDLGNFYIPAFAEEKPIVYISALTGENVESLKREIVRNLIPSVKHREETVLTLERHKNSIERAVSHLNDAHQTLKMHLPRDLLLTDVRSGLDALLEITGENATEAILERIFSTFCVGK